MTDINKNNKETDTEMLARLMANGFAQMKEQIVGVHSNLQNQIDMLQSEMRTGFADNRFEHREINRHLESIDRKQAGTLESLDETVPRREFAELEERVIVLETKFA
jgi:hypothetical protein